MTPLSVYVELATFRSHGVQETCARRQVVLLPHALREFPLCDPCQRHGHCHVVAFSCLAHLMCAQSDRDCLIRFCCCVLPLSRACLYFCRCRCLARHSSSVSHSLRWERGEQRDRLHHRARYRIPRNIEAAFSVRAVVRYPRRR